ncbi:MAG: metallophosphoesterase [Clostridia bacterium]|nr:metallophosphoesterase [Clostridia bacterium]
MALYAIGDLHLSLDGDKSMEAFGGRWIDYINKIERGFSMLREDDVCVLCGDLTWAMSLEDALSDFTFLSRLPSKKIIVKGNHDFWWSTAAKANRFFEEHALGGFEILNNNCIPYGDYALCGTRGWFYEEERGTEHDRKIMLREIGRLETSLKAAGDRQKLVFLHYPPKYQGYACEEILQLLEMHHASVCCYGHIHGKGCSSAFQGQYGPTLFKMVSADYLDFVPLKILD